MQSLQKELLKLQFWILDVTLVDEDFQVPLHHNQQDQFFLFFYVFQNHKN